MLDAVARTSCSGRRVCSVLGVAVMIDLLRSVDNNTTTMDLQQGLKVKRRAREGGLIMGALVELEKARSCGARECVKERSRLTIPLRSR